MYDGAIYCAKEDMMKVCKNIIILLIAVCLCISVFSIRIFADADELLGENITLPDSQDTQEYVGVVMDDTGKLWYMPEQIPLTFLSSEEYNIIVKYHLYTETDKILTDSRLNAEIVWDYWYWKTQNPYGVAGLMGNISVESGFNPINLQEIYEKNGWGDWTYTDAVDNGTYKNFANDGAGYGLVQWTYCKYKEDLLKYAKSRNSSIGDIYTQLDFLNQQFEGSHEHVGKALRHATSIRYASDVVLLRFECPADMGEWVRQCRASQGRKWYNYCISRCDMLDEMRMELDALLSHGRGMEKMLDMQYKVNMAQGSIVGNFYSIDVSTQERVQAFITTLLTE